VEALVGKNHITHYWDVINDPRMFADNVIKKRMLALLAMSIISRLLSTTAYQTISDMDKNMNWSEAQGFLQFVAFALICLAFMLYTLTTYVMVAQQFHILRLSTSGPLGVEAAMSYYINKNIVLYRHLGIKGFFWSLPLFIVSQGIRLGIKFLKDNSKKPELPNEVPLRATVQGCGFCAAFAVASLLLFIVHWTHDTVYEEKRRTCSTEEGFMNYQNYTMVPSMASDTIHWDDVDC